VTFLEILITFLRHVTMRI